MARAGPKPTRPDADWTDGLRDRGAAGAAAAQDLATYLRRTLRRIVGGRCTAAELDEIVQESLLRIVRSLDSFRGDCAFPTWATAIATRVAFTELRRRTARSGRVQRFEDVRAEVAALTCPMTPSPEAAATHANLLEVLGHAIATELTERQRLAIVCELRGIPTVEIAAQLGTNQNALYKLVHDGRKKLRTALAARGFGETTVRQILAEAKR